MSNNAKDNSSSKPPNECSLPSVIAKMKTIKEVHDYYQKIISCMPNNVFWLDKNCITQGCNANVLKFVGLEKPEDFVGITYEHMGKIAGWAQGHAQLYKHDDQEVMSSRKPKLNSEDPPILNPDGTLSYYSTSRVPLFDDGQNVIGIVGISVDITEQKQLLMDLKHAKERAELANQAKTEFLANMRHDIRTPLSGIVGFSEILKSETTDPRIKEYAENLIASSNALLDLMDEVLDAIKVSSGEIPLLKKKFNLANIFEHVTKLYSAKAAEKKLALSYNYDPELPQFVIGDRVRLHRIVLELVGNALNFTDSGQVTIRIESAKTEQQSLILRLIVADTGMGIPKDKQQDIYVQFKRLTPSYQGIYKGAGLGLYVVKQFIDELGGEIYVDSELRKGTVFTCLIPLQIPLLDNDTGVDSSDELKIPTALMVPLNHQNHTIQANTKILSHILVVEDNFIAQTVAKAILTSMDCRVDVASSGAEAVKLCEQHHYDLIFMDIGLGDGLDGYEVTQYIRENLQTTPHIPIIALTAHGADESKQRCIEAGMDAVLTKPLTQAHATDILHSFIPSRSSYANTAFVSTRKDLPDTDEELFQLNHFSLLDTDEALKNCGSLEMVQQLLALMITSLADDLALMKRAYTAHNFPLIEKTAHKIKGGAVYVGTIRLKYSCQYLERYWKSGERDLFEALYHQTITTIEETLTYIEGWLHKKK
ncbi:PAS domain-containing sensor histidine kinase [uncultured Legionella sp.]|uniref:PAS domain-containing sensor histidine kinase n=1 Tax=uncultured Legionella sp. TaxID=210934 RepID=UPI002625204C|nr:PAS domain-containing sensor histidine kinase [uncultured Legionella sp.]